MYAFIYHVMRTEGRDSVWLFGTLDRAESELVNEFESHPEWDLINHYGTTVHDEWVYRNNTTGETATIVIRFQTVIGYRR